MKRMFMVNYRYKEGLDDDDFRDLTKQFTQTGEAPGTVAHYERLDGRGGTLLQELTEEGEANYEATLRYAPWLEFEVVPVTTIEDAFPVIQRVYG